MRYVFCVGMYRACSTWQYEVLCHLVEAKLGGQRLGFLDADEFAAIRSQRPVTSPIAIMKSHDADGVFASSLLSAESVAVYAYRDLRDVAYSFMHKASLSFELLVSERFIPKVLSNDRFWRSQPGIFVQQYETLLTKQLDGVRQLADRLGIKLNDGEADRLAEAYSWQANFRRTLDVRRDAEAAGIDLGDQANTNKQDPLTLLHWNHMRVRRSTSWRELSTVRERETLAYLCGDWLIANGYETDMSWVESPYRASRLDASEKQPLSEESPAIPPPSSQSHSQGATGGRLREWLRNHGSQPVSGRKVGG